jgi:hypothetical protein
MNTISKILSAMALLAVPVFAQSESPRLESPSVECNRVFEEARRLPAPSPRSIYNYGRRVVGQGSRCLESGFNSVLGGARRAN